MPDLFRHPPGGKRQVPEWTPEQVRGDGPLRPDHPIPVIASRKAAWRSRPTRAADSGLDCRAPLAMTEQRPSQPPVMPDLFRHPPGGKRQAAGWTPEQAPGVTASAAGPPPTPVIASRKAAWRSRPARAAGSGLDCRAPLAMTGQRPIPCSPSCRTCSGIHREAGAPPLYGPRNKCRVTDHP